MTPLTKLTPKEVNVNVILATDTQDIVTLTLRPYTVADYAWFQEHFSEGKDQEALAKGHLEAIAKIAWYQLTAESKNLFLNVTYRKHDEDSGEEIEVPARGYHKLMYALYGEESFWALLDAFIRCKGLNGFVEDPKEVGLKKKKRPLKKRNWIGRVFSTIWPRTTDIRQIKYFN